MFNVGFLEWSLENGNRRFELWVRTRSKRISRDNSSSRTRRAIDSSKTHALIFITLSSDHQAILNKIQPIIRRDCNYSNLDRIKKDASFDEDEDKWTLPDLVVMRTKLPSPTDKGNKCPSGPHQQIMSTAIHSNSFKSSSSSERLLSNGMSNSASSGSSDSYNQVSCLSSISFLTIWTTEKWRGQVFGKVEDERR